MELWIRSQNKEKLVKVNELSLYDSNILKNDFVLNDEPDYSNISIIANDNYNLGTYKSKERALEILDEIQKLIKPTFKINYEYDDSQPIIDGEWLKSLKAESKIEELSCYVYEMPKE